MAAKWTFLVYMAGNNSLSGAVDTDLREMGKVGSSAQLAVMAFVKQVAGNALYLKVGKGRKQTLKKLPRTVDSGSPQTLVDFVRWAVQTAPAERYALVIWNHGGGWIPDGPDALYEKVRGLRRGAIGRHEANHLATTKLPRVLFTPTLEKIASLGSARDRMIASDDGTGHSLDTIEVQRVLEAAAEAMGRPIDLFGMDACLMSTLEVAYQVRATSRVVAGSEELEPEAGWCYDEILRAIADQPAIDGAALGTAVVNRYVDSYQDQTDVWPVTQAAVDTARIDQFTATFGRLAEALRAGLPGAFLDLYQARAGAVKFDFDQVDLRTFCRELLGRSGDAALRQAAQGVVDALAPGGYVLAEGHLGATVEESGGISVYFPEASGEISGYYKDLAFAADHHWDEFLAAYHAAARG